MLLRVAGVPFGGVLQRGERGALSLGEIVERRWIRRRERRHQVDTRHVRGILLAEHALTLVPQSLPCAP